MREARQRAAPCARAFCSIAGGGPAARGATRFGGGAGAGPPIVSRRVRYISAYLERMVNRGAGRWRLSEENASVRANRHTVKRVRQSPSLVLEARRLRLVAVASADHVHDARGRFQHFRRGEGVGVGQVNLPAPSRRTLLFNVSWTQMLFSRILINRARHDEVAIFAEHCDRNSRLAHRTVEMEHDCFGVQASHEPTQCAHRRNV